MRIDVVDTDRAPRPNGHYSQAVVHGGLAHLSMQLPFAPGSDELSPDVEGQMDQLLANCEAILAAAGSDIDQVLSVSIYLTDVADWPVANAVFARRFASHRPARAMVPVSGLHRGARVGMQLIAAAAR